MSKFFEGGGWPMVDHRPTKHFMMSVLLTQESIMIDLNTVETIPSDLDFIGLITETPKAAKVTPTAILEAFKAIKGTHRYDALMCLARNFGKPISRAKLLTAVYGDDDKSRVGALGMCLEGARKSIKNNNLPFRLVKQNATIALVSAN
jgi:hypothetical protein